ncbi:MAG: RluA family pseudouridine synthase [Firmicutes bacterium]|nr:RluA family pseudouridine synthase [Bacillota bacterium]
MELEYIANEKDRNRTVKSILKNEFGLSGRMVKKLKRNSLIYVNSSPVYITSRVQPGDMVHVSMDFEEECDNIIPENVDIDVIYEDEHMIILNKQPGIVVHPTVSHPTGTLANALMYYLKARGVNRKIRPVSRLDRDTSGVIVFAKNPYIQNLLTHQMSNNLFIKEYRGIVHGILSKTKGTINLPIARNPDSIMLRHVVSTGRPCVTHFEVLKYLDNATYLGFILETGRTHQIRVHCHAIGHPIIGDSLYSCSSTVITRQALHSYKVVFNHPISGQIMEFIAPLPEDMVKTLEILGK